MKIKLCEENFIQALKKGSALVLTLSMLTSFNGCSIERNQNKNTESSLISSSLLEEQKNKNVYQFNFKEKKQEEVPEFVDYDWDKFLENLKNNDNTVFDMVLGNEDISRFAITFHREEGDIYNTYIQLVDINGNSISEDFSYYAGFENIIHINDSLTMVGFHYSPNFENEYIIFNHATGEFKKINAVRLDVHGDYIIKKSKSEDTVNTYFYELLYSNGQLASDEKYSKISFDKETNCLFLVDLAGKTTEIVNIETNETVKIGGIVDDAYNNYLVIRKNGECKIYYLDDFYNVTFKEITENESFYDISIVRYENKIPRFICCKTSDDNNKIDYFLYDEKGKQLSTRYDYLDKIINQEYFYAYDKMDNTLSNNNIISFIDKEGNEVVSKIEASHITHIPGTDKVILYESNDNNILGKAGIIDFNNNVIVPSVYDNIVFYRPNIDKADEFVLVGFMTDENGVEYDVVYDKEINELARGKDADVNYQQIAKDYYSQKSKIKDKATN